MRRCQPSRVACLATAVLVAAGCRRQEQPIAPPNVLLVTVDTLRPDALGWVAGRNTTPFSDRIAREGFRFARAVAPAPLTLPSHAAMMTGRLPGALGLRDNGQVLGDVPTLAAALRERGFETGAFVSGAPLLAVFGLDRGFAHYDDELPEGSPGEKERTAARTTAAAVAWLATARRPFFAWVHYYDPHYPYEPPPALRREGPRGAYDGEMAAVDAALAGLHEAAGGADLLTVFASDHGESLGEHGEGTHGFFVYESTVAVPLVFHWPGRIGAGSADAGVRLVDLTPTVLDLLGLPPLPLADGRSLRPLLEGRESGAVPAAFVETWQPWTSYGWAPLAAVRQDGWKLIEAPRPELYDLVNDPAEAHNLVDARPEKARALRAVLERTRPAVASLRPAAADGEALERLRALGYVGAGGPMGEPPPSGLRDPKDGARLREALTRGDLALRAGEHRRAAAAFEAVLREDPDNRFALLRGGVALVRAGRTEEARRRLERAVALQPDSPDAREALADAWTRQGRHAEAAAHWQELARLQPRRVDAWTRLGAARGLSGRAADAVEAYRRAVSLRPGDAQLLLRLGFACHAAGRLEEAAGHLRAAAALSPASFTHAAALGVILARLGRGQEARAWLEAATAAEADFAQARFELAKLEAEAGRSDRARQALREALAADPALRARARSEARLAALLR